MTIYENSLFMKELHKTWVPENLMCPIFCEQKQNVEMSTVLKWKKMKGWLYITSSLRHVSGYTGVMNSDK